MTLHDAARIRERLATVADPVGFLVNLFAHAPVGFAVWNAEGQALLTNKAFFDIFLSEPPPEYNVLKDELLAKNGMLPLFQRAFRGVPSTSDVLVRPPRAHRLRDQRGSARRRVDDDRSAVQEHGRDRLRRGDYKDETKICGRPSGHQRLRRGATRGRRATRRGRTGAREAGGARRRDGRLPPRVFSARRHGGHGGLEIVSSPLRSDARFGAGARAALDGALRVSVMVLCAQPRSCARWYVRR